MNLDILLINIEKRHKSLIKLVRIFLEKNLEIIPRIRYING